MSGPVRKKPSGALSRRAAADLIGVSLRTIEKYLAAGVLESVEVYEHGLSRRVYIRRAEVNRFLRERGAA